MLQGIFLDLNNYFNTLKDLSSSKGPGLVVLRIGNELIRRASKSSDAAFCGEVLLFLSKIFPSGERSGANLRGDLNVDNTISLEERSDAMLSNYDAALLNRILASAEDEIVPYSFYLDFWHLQHCFLHPHQTLQPEHWSKFCKVPSLYLPYGFSEFTLDRRYRL